MPRTNLCCTGWRRLDRLHSLLLQDAIPDDATLSPGTTSTGLNLVESVNGVGALAGRALSDSTAAGSTFISLLNDYTDPDDGWSDKFT